MCNLKCIPLGLVLCLCVCLGTVLPARGETGSSSEGWKFAAEAYLWAAGIEGTSAAGDDLDVSFSDVLDSLDVGLMGSLAAQKGKWTLFADLIYLSIDDESSSTANFVGIPVKLDVDLKLKGFVSTLAAAHRVFGNDKASLDLLAGARYFTLDTDLKVDIGPRTVKDSDSGDVVDGIIGARGTLDLNKRWYLTCYTDIGAGESDLTWQVRAGAGYRFERFDVVAGYRHLAWEFDDKAFDDLAFSGPILGARFRF